MRFKTRSYSVTVLSIIMLILVISSSLFFLLEIESQTEEPKYKGKETIDLETITIKQLYEDASFAWECFQTRRDIYGPLETELYFTTEIETNINGTPAGSFENLDIFYSMFIMTNDQYYLDKGLAMVEDMFKYSTCNFSKNNKTLQAFVSYDWRNDETTITSLYPPILYMPLAEADPRFLPYFEKILVDSHEMFWSPINLVYKGVTIDGDILTRQTHITWGISLHKQIQQFYWLYFLTENSTYKNWADETVEAYWNCRSRTTNLLPRNVDSDNGGALDSSISHYDMANWLNTLLVAFILNNNDKSAGTGINTYYDLIEASADAISNYMWNSNRWVYKCTYTTGFQSSPIPEMNSFYVDYAMIRAYEIIGKQEYLDKAILDFDTEFMGSDPKYPNGVLMAKSLVIHSPSTLGRQSQFTGSSNHMVARTAYMIYLYTRNSSYLAKSKVHYEQLMSKHKFSNGYARILDTSTFEPFPNYLGDKTKYYDRAAMQSVLSLQNAFITSSEAIQINWAFGLNTSLPDCYGKPGAITNVRVDCVNNIVYLKSVKSSVSNGTISINYDPDLTIRRVEENGLNYNNFFDSTLEVSPGIHEYTIYFDSKPKISPIEDIFMINGSSGNIIRWETSGDDLTYYIIEENSILLYNQTWTKNTIELDIDYLEVGSHSFTLTIFNQKGLSESSIVTVKVEVVPLTLKGPVNFSYAENTTNNSITWIAMDKDPLDYYITLNGSLFENDTWDGNDITIFIDGLLHGTYIFQCTIRNGDLINNTLSDEVIVQVVDTTIPLINNPLEINYSDAKEGNIITWYVSDLNPSYYEIYKDDELILHNSWNSNFVKFNVDNLSYGTHTFKCVIFDVDLNSASSIVKVNVDDTIKPIISPLQDRIIYEGTSILLEWETFDRNPDYYEISMDNQLEKESIWNSSQILYHVSGLSYGSYSLELKCYDKAGNFEVDNLVMKVVDDSKPSLTELPDLKIKVNSPINLSWKALDTDPGDYEIYIDNIIVQTGFWNNNENITLSLDSLTIGEHNVTIVVWDYLENSVKDEVIINVVKNSKTPYSFPVFWLMTTTVVIISFKRLNKRITTSRN